VDDKIKNVKCYPFEKREDIIDFTECSNSIVDSYTEGKHPNIRSFSQKKGEGKTFEYSIAFENPKLDLFIVDNIANNIELKELIKAHADGKNLDELIAIHSKVGKENERVIDSIKKSSFSHDELKKHLIASRFLNSLSKGENAYDLAHKIQTNLPDNKYKFIVPQYISNAIEWICK
jgi:putative ATP-dependent endonuclease of the OLD family